MPLRDYEHMDLPDGITPEEARWYSQQRQEDIDIAVKRAVSLYSRRAIAGYLILLAGLIFVWAQFSHEQSDRRVVAKAQRETIVKSGRVVSVSGCNRDFKTTLKLRAVFFASKDFTKVQHDKGIISDERYRRSIKFYDDQLNSIRLPDCREAATVVSQEPNKPLKIPEPLYPGGPGDTEAHPG